MESSHHILITFVSAAVLGVFLFLIAQRLKVSAIVLLLIGGILAGPEFLNIVRPSDLGKGLNTIISLAVGLILFEGGLTLDAKGYRQVSSEIWGVLTKGVVITWGLTTLTIKAIFGFEWAFCLLAASLIIVTGPTVVGPILQRIRVKKNLHNILYWEGVLIDPIGVFIALLCYEWIISAGTPEAYFNFFFRFFVGAAMGISFGIITYEILRKNLIPENRLNFFAIATAMLNFALANSIVSESGLLSVTIAGLILGYKDTPQLDRIIEYKVELKDFLIGLLFILLAANLSLAKFTAYGTTLIWAIVIVMLLIRPLNIFISTAGSPLAFREKMFLSWIAPRGIVAASMSSLFAFNLTREGFESAGFLETFTYAVIVGTVIFQGFSAKWVGKLLGVLEPKPKGWLIVGANKLGRAAAHFIKERGHSVILMDTNPREVKLARREGLTALCESALIIDPVQHVEFYGIGNIMAITGNEDLNQLIVQRWHKIFSFANLYYWGYEDIQTAETFRHAVGKPIWTDIDLKSILAQNIQQNEIFTCVVTSQLAKFDRDKGVLICEFDGLIYLSPPYDEEGEATFLTLRPSYSGLEKSTNRNWITFSSDRTLDELYDKMLTLLKRDIPEIDIKKLHKELVQREKEFSSIIGHGVSLPHTYTENLDKSILMIARLNPPIKCQHSEALIDLVFMVLSPENQPEEHLAQISKIAKFVTKEETRAALLAVKNSAELYNIIEKT
ncbi:MAG: cation:proton antiporter [Proteobacteria bacterium]|nr:cation:proton antiporter [Pseudomonadota bacterium]